MSLVLQAKTRLQASPALKHMFALVNRDRKLVLAPDHKFYTHLPSRMADIFCFSTREEAQVVQRSVRNPKFNVIDVWIEEGTGAPHMYPDSRLEAASSLHRILTAQKGAKGNLERKVTSPEKSILAVLLALESESSDNHTFKGSTLTVHIAGSSDSFDLKKTPLKDVAAKLVRIFKSAGFGDDIVQEYKATMAQLNGYTLESVIADCRNIDPALCEYFATLTPN